MMQTTFDIKPTTGAAPSKRHSFLDRLIARGAAYLKARTIIRSKKEAEMIHAGKKKAKSIDALINEL
jgi:hypothetical protein